MNSSDSYLSATSITPTGDPMTYEYAISTPESAQWREAMEEEMQEKGTWKLADLPEDRTKYEVNGFMLLNMICRVTSSNTKHALLQKGFHNCWYQL